MLLVNDVLSLVAGWDFRFANEVILLDYLIILHPMFHFTLVFVDIYC
jgi:hypothetical protein